MARACCGVAAVGAALLVWLASPLWWDGILEAGVGGIVTAMAVAAVLCGLAVGTIVAFVRSGLRISGAGAPLRRLAPVLVFVALSLPAFLPFAFFAAPFDQTDRTGQSSGRAVEVCAGWVAYVALAYAAQLLIARALFATGRTKWSTADPTEDS